jgi:hypothetical protein
MHYWIKVGMAMGGALFLGWFMKASPAETLLIYFGFRMVFEFDRTAE